MSDSTQPVWNNVAELDARRTEATPLMKGEWLSEMLTAARASSVRINCNVCDDFTMTVKKTKKGLPFAHCSACWIQYHLRSPVVMKWFEGEAWAAVERAEERRLQNG